MQFYFSFDPNADPMELLELIAAYFTEQGFPAEKTFDRGEHGLFIRQKLCINTDSDPEDSESRRSFADFLKRDYGIRTGIELNGQLYSLCSEQEFCDMVQYLLAHVKGDVFLYSEWDDMILVRCGEKLTIREDWQQYFSCPEAPYGRHFQHPPERSAGGTGQYIRYRHERPADGAGACWFGARGNRQSAAADHLAGGAEAQRGRVQRVQPFGYAVERRQL